MDEQYIVNYSIHVDTTQANASIQAFKGSVASTKVIAANLKEVGAQMSTFSKTAFTGMSEGITQMNSKLATVNKSFMGVGKGLKTSVKSMASSIKSINLALDKIQKRGEVVLKLNTTDAEAKLDRILLKVNEIKKSGIIPLTASVNGSNRGTSVAAVSRRVSASSSAAAMNTREGMINRPWYRPSPYSMWGSSYYNSGTSLAGGMVKGMGIAYALSSVMTGIGNVFKDASEYQNLVTTMQGILQAHDNRPDFMKDFQATVFEMRQIAADTKFTAPQAAAAGRQLAMAGLDVNQIKDAIRPIANIAVIGDTSLPTTAEAMTTIITGYKIPARKMDKAADILTETFVSTNSTLMTLSESFKYSATLFHAAGVPFEDATAALGVLGDAGIKGSQAGTSMRAIILNLLKPTNLQEKAWKGMGVERTDKYGNLRPIREIFRDLKNKGMTVRDAGYMFHRTSVASALALTANLDKWDKVTQDNKTSTGLSSRFAYLKENYTVSGLWHQLTSAFTEQGIRKFTKLQLSIMNFLRSIITMIKSPAFVESLSNAMNMFMQLAKSIVSVFKIFSFVFNMAPGLFSVFMRLQMGLAIFAGTIKTFWSVFKFIFVGGIAGGIRWIWMLGKAVILLTEAKSTLKAISVISAALTGTTALRDLVMAGGAGAAVKGATAATEVAKSAIGNGAAVGGGLTAAKLLRPTQVAVQGELFGAGSATLFSEAAMGTSASMAIGGGATSTAVTTAGMSLGAILGSLGAALIPIAVGAYSVISYNKRREEEVQKFAEQCRKANPVLEMLGLNAKKAADKLSDVANGPKSPSSVSLKDKNFEAATSLKGFRNLVVTETGAAYREDWDRAISLLNGKMGTYNGLYGKNKYGYGNGVYNMGGISLPMRTESQKRISADILSANAYLAQQGNLAGKRDIDYYMDLFGKARNKESFSALKNDLFAYIQKLASGAGVDKRYDRISVDELSKLDIKKMGSTRAFNLARLAALKDTFVNSTSSITTYLTAISNILGITGNVLGGTKQDFLNMLASLPRNYGGVPEAKYLSFDKNGNLNIPNWSNTTQSKVISAVQDAAVNGMFNTTNSAKGVNKSLDKYKKNAPVLNLINPEKNTKPDPLGDDFNRHKHGAGSGSGNSGFKPTNYGYGASPKQIVIRINNLMNVDKVDMTDEKKSGTIANLRTELAQILVDVVADAGELMQQNI